MIQMLMEDEELLRPTRDELGAEMLRSYEEVAPGIHMRTANAMAQHDLVRKGNGDSALEYRRINSEFSILCRQFVFPGSPSYGYQGVSRRKAEPSSLPFAFPSNFYGESSKAE